MKKTLTQTQTIIIIIVASIISLGAGFGIYNYFKKNSTPKVFIKKEVPLDFIKKEVTMEINGELPDINEFFKDDSFLNDFPLITYYKDGEQIDVDPTKIDSYDVIITYLEKEYTSKLSIVDQTPPEVTLGRLTINEGDAYIARHFIKSYSDNSKNKNYKVSYKNNKDATITDPGTHNISLHICDTSDNCIDDSAILVINENNENRKYVKSVTEEEIVKVVEVKYGVKEVTTQEVTYSVYDDGSKVEVFRSDNIISYDYSGYDHKYLSDMKKEATVLSEEQGRTRMDMLLFINEMRREKDISTLTIDSRLSVLAIVRAMEFAYSNTPTNTDTRPYSEPYNTFESFWYEPIFDFNTGINSLAGELSGQNEPNDESMIASWRRDQSSYELLIDKDFTKIGIGKYKLNNRTYWVILLS